MQYTRLLGKYASELKYEDLPAEVIEQAKKITLHTIAVAIASMNVPTAQKAVEMVRRKCGTPEAGPVQLLWKRKRLGACVLADFFLYCCGRQNTWV